jgi:hypothetical protein
MAPHKPPSESRDKAEGSDPPNESMEKLRSLTKGLLGVSLAAVKDAEMRFRERQKKPPPD